MPYFFCIKRNIEANNKICKRNGVGCMKRHFKFVIYVILFIILVSVGWYVFLSNKSMKQVPKRAKLVFNENIKSNGVICYKKY